MTKAKDETPEKLPEPEPDSTEYRYTDSIRRVIRQAIEGKDGWHTGEVTIHFTLKTNNPAELKDMDKLYLASRKDRYATGVMMTEDGLALLDIQFNITDDEPGKSGGKDTGDKKNGDGVCEVPGCPMETGRMKHGGFFRFCFNHGQDVKKLKDSHPDWTYDTAADEFIRIKELENKG